MNRGVFNDRASNATGQAVAQDADSRGVLDGVPVSDSTQRTRCSEWPAPLSRGVLRRKFDARLGQHCS